MVSAAAPLSTAVFFYRLSGVGGGGGRGGGGVYKAFDKVIIGLELNRNHSWHTKPFQPKKYRIVR
jgi:hypothetical protein